MPAREPGSIVLRCVNRRAHPVHGSWRLRQPVDAAHLARLDETLGEQLTVHDGTITFTAAPMEIITIVARLGEPT
jgi:hypothetical protein